MDKPPRIEPMAMPALSEVERPLLLLLLLPLLSLLEEEEEVPVAVAVLLLAEEDAEPELKSLAVTLKQGT